MSIRNKLILIFLLVGIMPMLLLDTFVFLRHQELWYIVVFAVTRVIIILLLYFMITRLVTKRVNRLRDVAGKLAKGKLKQRAEVEGTDEIDELAESINTMAAELGREYSSMEDKVVESSSMLAQAEKVARMGSWEFDIPSGTLTWSEELYRILGLSPRRKPSVALFMSVVHPEDQEIARISVERAMTSSEPVTSTLRIVRPTDGATRVVESHSEATDAVRDIPIRMIGTVHDITEQYELMQRQRDFVSIASHELRTPITALIGYIAMLQSAGSSPTQQRRFISRAHAAANRLSSLIEDLLNVARLEEGRTTFEYTIFHPHQLVRSAIEDFTPRAQERQQQLKVRNRLESTDAVKADAEKLRQAISNLIDNAIKYTPAEGHISVTLEHDGRWIAIRIKDDGIGIHPANIERVTDKFYREYSEMSVAAGGTGLGLFITRELVERQGGQLVITSEVDHGTTVSIRMPRVRRRSR